jgi:hypothetical protein
MLPLVIVLVAGCVWLGLRREVFDAGTQRRLLALIIVPAVVMLFKGFQ